MVPGIHTYAALIKMYAGMGEVEQAQEMYMRLRDTNVVPPYWIYKYVHGDREKSEGKRGRRKG